MDTDGIVDYISENSLEIMLMIAGLMSIIIVGLYMKKRDSGWYKLSVAIGAIAGALMVVTLLNTPDEWTLFDTTIVAIAGFALLIRPFKDTDFAIIIAILVMALAYLYLGSVTGDFEALSTGWPRIIMAVVAGALVYMILNFIQKVAQFIGKVLNIWLVLFILGAMCLVEGVLLITNNPSIFDYYNVWKDGSSIVISLVNANL